MNERAYRQRLEADLVRWQSEGLLAPTAGDTIRASFGPMPAGVTIATVVAIVGGLLIAAAFLAFVAANWSEIPRPYRFLLLLAGIAGAYGTGAWFARARQVHVADLCAGVGSIIFGAAITLVGQMYHLAGDFAAGLMLLSIGALVSAALTGSRGALAVALVAGCWWSGMRVNETSAVHLPFLILWLAAALLAVAWNAAVARHLLGAAALAWLAQMVLALDGRQGSDPIYFFLCGDALLFGAALLLAGLRPKAVRDLGITLTHYAAFGLALALAAMVAEFSRGRGPLRIPAWVEVCGLAGIGLALVAAALQRSAATALAAAAAVAGLIVVSGWLLPLRLPQPWSGYAVLLGAMLVLVVSGMLDDVRPRIVAGWLGLAGMIAALTWVIHATLLQRAFFLAVAGVAAVALASFLGRSFRQEPAR